MIKWYLFLIIFCLSMLLGSTGLVAQSENEIETLNKNQNRVISEQYYETGIQCMDLDKYREAIYWFKKSSNLYPLNYLSFYYRGLCYERISEYQEAFASYNLAIAVNPKFTEALFSRGLLYFKLKEYQNTIYDFNLLLGLPSQETQAVYFRGISYGKAIKQAGFDLIFTLENKKSDIYNYLGLSYQYTGRPEEAMKSFNEAIRLYPEDDNLFVTRGAFYLSIADTIKALKDFEKALSLNSENISAQLNLVGISSVSTESRVLTLTQLIAKDSTLSFTYQQRAYQYFVLGKYDSAFLDYTKALEIDPDNYELYSDRGLVYERLDANDEALSDYRKSALLNPGWPNAWRGQGNIYFKVKDYKEGIISYSRSIEIESDYGPAYYNRGLCHYYSGDIQNACLDMANAWQLGIMSAEQFIMNNCPD